MRPYALIASAALCAVATLNAQSFTTHPCGNNSDDRGTIARFFGGAEQACELRTTTFPLVSGHLNVESMNGGIEVIGEDRQDIALEARVTARAGSQSDAADILHQITIATGGTVEAHGPKVSGSRNWSVSYKLHVPHHLAGDVRVSTTNGGVHATLDGTTWRGSRLDLGTTNGAISVSVPANYSAHLKAETTNGGISLNHPAADQSGVHRHEIDTNLGSGGPTISFTTTNGGISIQ